MPGKDLGSGYSHMSKIHQSLSHWLPCMVGGRRHLAGACLFFIYNFLGASHHRPLCIHQMTSKSTLRILADIISEAVDTIEGVYTTAGQELPSLDDSFNPKAPAETLRQDPVVSAATLNLVAAAGQIAAVMQDPVLSALNNAHAVSISLCASELNVVEILREGGEKGVHVKQIATPSRADPLLLARILRLLATHHMFREVSPGVFANNRISSALDKGKPTKVLFEDRPGRLAGSSGAAALAEFLGDECFKSSSHLTDALLDPEGTQNLFTRAFNTEEPMFNWFQRPENAWRIARFGMAMHGTSAAEPPKLILTGFDWSTLPDGGVIVDVGGGLGSTSMEVVKEYPKLRVVNQDLGPTIENAKAHWEKHFPEYVKNQMVELQVHDFFTPQPVKNASVFLVRYVVHDWSDERTLVIFKHLREAAQPTTKLVIIENIIRVAGGAETEDEEVKKIPGATRPTAQPPLLPNWGKAAGGVYYYDITVHNLIGGGERTLEGFVHLLAEAGWKLVQVHACPGSELSHIVASPV